MIVLKIFHLLTSDYGRRALSWNFCSMLEDVDISTNGSKTIDKIVNCRRCEAFKEANLNSQSSPQASKCSFRFYYLTNRHQWISSFFYFGCRKQWLYLCIDMLNNSFCYLCGNIESETSTLERQLQTKLLQLLKFHELIHFKQKKALLV